jgi:hypothetical protein
MATHRGVPIAMAEKDSDVGVSGSDQLGITADNRAVHVLVSTRLEQEPLPVVVMLSECLLSLLEKSPGKMRVPMVDDPGRLAGDVHLYTSEHLGGWNDTMTDETLHLLPMKFI